VKNGKERKTKGDFFVIILEAGMLRRRKKAQILVPYQKNE